MTSRSAFALLLCLPAAALGAPAVPAPAASPLAGYLVIDLHSFPAQWHKPCGDSPLLFLKKSDYDAAQARFTEAAKGGTQIEANGLVDGYCLSTDAAKTPTYRLDKIPLAGDKTTLHYHFGTNELLLDLQGPTYGVAYFGSKQTPPVKSMHQDWGPRVPTAEEIAVPPPPAKKPAVAAPPVRRPGPAPAPAKADASACAALAKKPDAAGAAACLFSDPKERAATLQILTPDQQKQLVADAVAAGADSAKRQQASDKWRQAAAAVVAPVLRSGALPPGFAAAGLSRADALGLYCGKFPPPAAAKGAPTALAQLKGVSDGAQSVDGAAAAADPLAADCAKAKGAAGPAPAPPVAPVEPGAAPAKLTDLHGVPPAPAGLATAKSDAAPGASSGHPMLGLGAGFAGGAVLGFLVGGPVGMVLGAMLGGTGGFFVGSKL